MKNKKITILGIGNTLFSDEGVGIHVLPLLEEMLSEMEDIEIVEGLTDGMKLLGPVEEAESLLIIDAINAGRPGGEILVLDGDEVPAYFGIKMSVHQLGFQEVLFAAKLRDRYPKNIAMIGMQPTSLKLGIGLTEQNERMVSKLIEAIEKQIEKWRATA